MCLRKLFCRHKKLTAIGIYEPYDPDDTSTYNQINVVCRCDKCGAEVQFEKHYMQLLRHEFRADIDVSAVVDSNLWGKW